uniref:NNMT/PNMT/TEMT family protein n=1 Tax=Panagrolaimus sp. ES5 TaxID=591445 RepID=A0AC34GNA6_9BILA
MEELNNKLDKITIDENAEHDVSKDPIYAAKDHDIQFDPKQYLEGFYKTAKEDTAMQVVLFFLPGVLYRLPEKIENLLDLGAGPTVYIPIAVRKRAENIFTSDYAEANRQTLKSWIESKSEFDWTNVCTWLSNIEATSESPKMMQELARSKMRGIFSVNVHKDTVIQEVYYQHPEYKKEIPKQFDVVTTVFCLEYASETLEEYQNAVKNATSLIKNGGYLIQGGVLNADEYSFGGRRFRCHHLTKEQLLNCLKQNNMSTDEKESCFKLIIHDDIFILVSKKNM